MLFVVSVVLTVYTASAHYVASSVNEIEGHLFWPNTLGGSFIPWPYLPSGLAGQMLTPLNQVDIQYYTYVIRSGVLIYVTVALWVLVFWRVWKTRQSYKGMKKQIKTFRI